jgi:hypothetical protein
LPIRSYTWVKIGRATLNQEDHSVWIALR